MTADMSFLTTGANKRNRLTISAKPSSVACSRCDSTTARLSSPNALHPCRRGCRLALGGYGPPRRLVPDLPAAGRAYRTSSTACSRRRGIQEGDDGVLNQSRFKDDRHYFMDCHSRLGGNGLNKPLDSSFRWNDGGGKNDDELPRRKERSGLFDTSRRRRACTGPQSQHGYPLSALAGLNCLASRRYLRSLEATVVGATPSSSATPF